MVLAPILHTAGCLFHEPTVLVTLVGTDLATLPSQCWFTRLVVRIPENNIERGEGGGGRGEGGGGEGGRQLTFQASSDYY